MKEDIQKTFCLFRIYDKNHIICNSPLKYRQVYYAALKKFTQEACNIPSYKDFFESLKQLFSLSDNYNEGCFEEYFLFLNKVYRKRQAGFWGIFKKPEYSYKYVYNLIIEAGYINALLTEFNIDSWLIFIAEQFKLNENELAWFQEYLSILLSKNTELLLKQTDTEINFLRETISQTTKHIISEQEYEKLPVYNIAVVATMSAGKSTFINALLGNEIFPEANAACTTKITSVYDNDTFNRITGLVMKKGKIISALNNLDNNDLIRWNGDVNIDRVILEGNLDNISNKNKIVAVHDTPGTNFSGDNTHHDITFDFLTKNKMNAVIFIANAEHLATTDEFQLLTELYEKIVKRQKNKVIFVINKSDSIDADKEKVSDYCKKLRDEIVSIGFNPKSIIIPISAKSARLFKMAIKGKSLNFTQKEKNDFMTDISLLLEDNSIALASDIKASCHDTDDSSIYIENKSFSRNQLRKALYNTGLPNVEKALEMIAANLI